MKLGHRVAITRGPGRRCRKQLTARAPHEARDRKSTRLNSSHSQISYAVFCLKKKKTSIVIIVFAYINVVAFPFLSITPYVLYSTSVIKYLCHNDVTVCADMLAPTQELPISRT